jgi:hypothetical protein
VLHASRSSVASALRTEESGLSMLVMSIVGMVAIFGLSAVTFL